jgi:hypothetical protein
VACGNAGENLSVGTDVPGADAGGTASGSGDERYDAAAPAAPNVEAGPVTADGGGVVLYETQFEGTNACSEWTVTGGTISAVSGRAGNGCMVCANADEPSMCMRRDVGAIPPAGGRGLYLVGFSHKLVSATTSAYDFVPEAVDALSFDDQDGNPMPNGATANTTWSFGQSARNVTEPLSDTVLGVYLGGYKTASDAFPMSLHAGDCIAFDDLRVTFIAAP